LVLTWSRDHATSYQPQRELERDPNYVPDYLPKPTETSIDVNLTEEVDQLLQSLLATGDYLETKEHALLNSFLRFRAQKMPKDFKNKEIRNDRSAFQ
jgi:hypothetical protein